MSLDGTDPPKVAVVPGDAEPIRRAVLDAGARLVTPAEADALVWTDPLDAESLRDVLAASPARWVQLPFAGIERFVEAGVIDRSRTWTCAKGSTYGPATAELALTLVCAAARRIHQHARRQGWWAGEPGVEHRRIAGTTALVVGTGGIGSWLARALAALDVRVLAVNRSGTPLAAASRTAPATALPDLLPEADWVILAVALTPQTERMIDARALGAMRDDAWLVNVARGRLVDTDALVRALSSGDIGGAALDVTDPEPLPDDHPLWRLSNVIITSHTANTAAMALPELAALVRRNVERFAQGQPLENPVDPVAGY